MEAEALEKEAEAQKAEKAKPNVNDVIQATLKKQ